MTKKNRTVLFLACLILFILIAPTVVLYSQGYRFDLENKKISQTGGLFLKILPKQVEVYLDGKLEEKTDFFFGSALIENLLPKKYKIEVKKAGYYLWQKTLEIKEKEVTEVKNIVLFPENPNFSLLTKGVKSFWFSPGQKKIILKEANEKGWALKLYELEKNLKSHLVEEDSFFSTFTSINGSSVIDEGDIAQTEVDLLDLKFSENSKEIFLEVGAAEQVKYFSLGIDKTPPSLTQAEKPLPLEKKGDKDIWEKFEFLQAEEIKDLKISPDSKKIVYFSDWEIWILFLKDKEDQPQKKAGDKLFLIRLSEKINDVFWLNSDYLVFNAGDIIKISEIDERDRINVIDIGELKNPRIFWNKTDKKLYILSEGNLYHSSTLLP